MFASSIVGTTTEDQSHTARRNTAPAFRAVEYAEAQQEPIATSRRRPSGVRRLNTNGSLGSQSTIELRGLESRRNTFASNDSTLTSPAFERPTLERRPTYRVEDEALHGYPKLAKFLGGTQGYAIYKRFAALNARNVSD